MEIDKALYERLIHEGGTFVCLGLPSGSEFGIDMKYFTSVDKFYGIKMIPPGVHFVYYSVENSHGDQSPRVGFLHCFKKGEVVVKKWDGKEEEFVDETSEEVVARIKSNLKAIDKNLGAYPFDVWAKWKNLSNKISEKLIKKVLPLCGKVPSVLELKASQQDKNSGPSSGVAKRTKSKLFLCDEKREEILPHLEAVKGTELRFLKIPDQCYPENSSPSEITKHSLDSSYLFQCILSQHDDFSDVLGEVQLAFICFLIGCSFEAFEHWKKLIGIICSCDEAIARHSGIFSEFISILNYQLQEVQEDFLVDIVAGNNFVYRILRIFFRNLLSGNANDRLKAKGKRFQEFLTEKLFWDFSDILEEAEDELPVVVTV